MVKPPKTMQPESVDLTKAGRKSGRAFQADSFHQYLARKIDLQRSQFGLVLPPPPPVPPVPPPPPPSVNTTAAARSPRKPQSPWSASSSSSSPHQSSSSSPNKSRKRPRPGSTSTSTSTPNHNHNHNNNSNNRSVSFAPLPLRVENLYYDEEEEGDEDDDGDNLKGMSAILQNLKRRHGRGCRRVLSRHGKRKSRPHKSTRRRLELELNEPSSNDMEDQQQQQQQQPGCSAGQDHKDEGDHPSTNDQQGDPPLLSPMNNSSPTFDFSTTIATMENDDESYILSTTATATATATTPPSSSLKLRRERPDLFFLGVVVKVTGYTDPDNETIKRLLQRHGGDFETYETERVTHIVAEHMSTTKANYLKKQRRPRPVVLPSWISDCVKVGKLLPHGDYLLEELQDHPSTSGGGRQIGMKDLFSAGGAKPTQKKKAPIIHEAPKAQPPPPLSSREEYSNSLAAATDTLLERQQDSTCSSSIDVDVDVTVETLQTESTSMALDFLPLTQFQEKTYNGRSTNDKDLSETTLLLGQPDEDCGVEGDDNDDDSPAEGTDTTVGFPTNQISTTEVDETRTSIEEDNTHENPSSTPTLQVVPPERPRGKTDGKYIHGRIRTVGTDPNFLESFFANSRLSFIGSYKQRTNNETSTTNAGSGKNVPSKEFCKRFVFHVDMDCFFANVVLRNYPEYRDKPVAISHHGKKHNPGGPDSLPSAPRPNQNSMNVSGKSTSECATCNYHARKFGIKKGMFLGRARQLCPELIVLHYDFAGYEEVSEQVLAILHRVATEHEGCVEAVSCDEAYMEMYLPLANEEGVLSGGSSTADDAAGDIAEMVRTEIFETTQCTASIGVATNKFLAKVGTDRVKPDGTFVVKDYRKLLEELKLRDLHGVGYRSEPKLEAEGLSCVQDVWDLGSKAESVLSRILGPGLGKKIYAFCHGRDDREVKPVERKTIGAECNYGVRFDGPYGIDHFINGLATEIEKRMAGVGCEGCKVTLKVKQRKKGAGEPPKFLGHGSCHNLSKSMDVPDLIPTRDAKVLGEVGMTLYRELKVPLDDVRGMGMVISKLSSDNATNRSPRKRNAPQTGIATFFENALKQNSYASHPRESESSEEEASKMPSRDDRTSHFPELRNERVTLFGDDFNFDEDIAQEVHGLSDGSVDADVTAEEGSLALPPLSQICMSQVAALPPEIQEEIHSRFARRERQQSMSPRAAPDEIIDVDEVEQDSSSAMTARPAAATKEPFVTKTAFGLERHHFRQTSLKRMMKLAAVKSGHERPEDMSLTQLQRLPLEIQLQIANQDSNPVGLLSQKPRGSNSGSHGTFAKPRQVFKHHDKYENSVGAYEKQARKRNHQVALSRNIRGQTTDTMIDMEAQSQMEADDDGLLVTPTNLFDDDILPLRHFLDQNSPSNADAIGTVCDFFCTCLKERRLNVIPPLVRSIKKRTDEWSNRLVLLQIIHEVDDQHERMYNMRLDIDWLLRD